MAKSLLHMANRKEDTIRIAQKEFDYPRDVLEEALIVSVKAIDTANPGGASDESLRKNIELTIVEPLNLKVDFSVLNEVQTELGIRKK